MRVLGARVLASPAFIYRRPPPLGGRDLKVTAYRSDISTTVIEDEKKLARIRVSYPNDRRRAVREIDATAEEAESMLGAYGRTRDTPGRRPS